LRLKTLALGKTLRGGEATLHLNRDRLRSFTLLKDEINALVINDAGPGIQLALAPENTVGSNEVLDGLSLSR